MSDKSTQTVLEEMGAYLGALAEDVSLCASAVTELAETQVTYVESLGRMEEMLASALAKMVEIYDNQRDLDQRVGAYIRDQSKHESGIRTVTQKLKDLEERFGQRES